jgi:hypothetical protein
VRNYLNAEHNVKKGKPFDFEGWEDAFNSVSTARHICHMLVRRSGSTQ